MKRLFIISFFIFLLFSCNESKNTKSKLNSFQGNSSTANEKRKEAVMVINETDSTGAGDEKFIEGALYPFDKVFILNW